MGKLNSILYEAQRPAQISCMQSFSIEDTRTHFALARAIPTAFICVCVCSPVHLCWCIWEEMLTSRCFPQSLSRIVFLKQNLPFEPGVSYFISIGWPMNSWDDPVSTPQCWSCRNVPPCHYTRFIFYMDSGNPNSDPHIYTANALPTGIFSQPLHYHFYNYDIVIILL